MNRLLERHTSRPIGVSPPTVVAVKADQRERLGRLLDAMEIEAGPVPAKLITEAQRLWQPVGSEDRPYEDEASA